MKINGIGIALAQLNAFKASTLETIDIVDKVLSNDAPEREDLYFPAAMWYKMPDAVSYTVSRADMDVKADIILATISMEAYTDDVREDEFVGYKINAGSIVMISAITGVYTEYSATNVELNVGDVIEWWMYPAVGIASYYIKNRKVTQTHVKGYRLFGN